MDQNIFLVSENDHLTRIDKFLSEKYNLKSRTYFQYLIENGSILVNNKKIKKRFIPKIGDEIEIFFQALENSLIEPQNIALDILYEDDDIIAINKPKNMVVHPAHGNWSNTFVNALLYHCKKLPYQKEDLRPGIVHRLDKDTTGILLAAKTQIAHTNLIEQFKNKTIEKKYLAIVLNKPQDQMIIAPIKRHPFKRKEMSVLEDGKEAITKIKVISFKNNLSLLEAFLITGRTHQIRVHLKHINCPVLGDSTYGNKTINKKFNVSSQLLHAYSLKFYHPITQKEMLLRAPIDENFQKFFNISS